MKNTTFNYIFLLLYILIANPLECQASQAYPEFMTNPAVPKKERQAVSKYLLPMDSPLKPILDSIFTPSVTFSLETLEAAGFIIKYAQPRTFIVVAAHPDLPGYLLKINLDSDARQKRHIPSWQWFVWRAQGANRIKKYIQKHSIEYFAVPQKWIYPLPIDPLATELSPYKKNVVLLVEDMHLVSDEENFIAWKTVMTPARLDELFAILLHNPSVGHACRPDNLFYTTSGKFAFIDTEYPNTRPNYNVLLPFLSPEMAVYWQKLIRTQF